VTGTVTGKADSARPTPRPRIWIQRLWAEAIGRQSVIVERGMVLDLADIEGPDRQRSPDTSRK